MTSLSHLTAGSRLRLATLVGLFFISGCSTLHPATDTGASYDASTKASARAASPASASLGTRWGEGRDARVTEVSVTRLNPKQANDILTLSYDGRSPTSGSHNKILAKSMANGCVAFSVTDNNGRKMQLEQKGDTGALRLAGHQGERYALSFFNQCPNMVYEIIATVDGLDVITGKPGSVVNAGYLAFPGRELVIDGFRKSNQEVAAFRFSSVAQSYANNTAAGDARNTGVIGVALFEVSESGREPEAKSEPGTSNAFPADSHTETYAPPPDYLRRR